MPELPEVEVVCRSLSPLVTGQRLLSIWTSGKALRSFPGDGQLLQPLVGQQLSRIDRRAKFLIFRFERQSLLMHLGMSGVASWDPQSDLTQQPPHCHLVCRFEQGLLRFVDPRRFGDLRLIEGLELPESLLGSSRGMEPLDPHFSGEVLCQAARGSRQAVKVWLMRGDPVVGVGNIYASEALFRAGIHPARAAGRISAARWSKLAETIQAVLREAIEAGGSTLRDFHGVSGEPGRYGGAHQVYGRAGLPCLTCGEPIHRMVQAQRATYFCKACQR